MPEEAVLHKLAKSGASFGLDIPAPAIVLGFACQELELGRCEPVTTVLYAAAFDTCGTNK